MGLVLGYRVWNVLPTPAGIRACGQLGGPIPTSRTLADPRRGRHCAAGDPQGFLLYSPAAPQPLPVDPQAQVSGLTLAWGHFSGVHTPAAEKNKAATRCHSLWSQCRGGGGSAPSMPTCSLRQGAGGLLSVSGRGVAVSCLDRALEEAPRPHATGSCSDFVNPR